MPRKSTGPKYYASRGGFYTCLAGKQHLLAKGLKTDPVIKKQAIEEYHRLQLTTLEPQAGDRIAAYTIVNSYCAWAEKAHKRRTFENRKQYLQPFSDAFGLKHVCDLSKLDAEKLMDDKAATWGNASRDQFITSINAAFNWAVDRKVVKSNPFKGLKKPVVKSRARTTEDYINDDVFARFCEVASRPTLDIVTILDATGARPEEIAVLTAADWHPTGGTLTPKVSKNERHEVNGRACRTIFVPNDFHPLVERLVKAHPTGALFRNNVGNPWHTRALSRWFLETRTRLGLTGEYTPYGLRHRFATRWLLNNGSIAKLAILIDTSVRVIEHHYGHLNLHGADLRRDLDAFWGAQDKGIAALAS